MGSLRPECRRAPIVVAVAALGQEKPVAVSDENQAILQAVIQSFGGFPPRASACWLDCGIPQMKRLRSLHFPQLHQRPILGRMLLWFAPDQHKQGGSDKHFSEPTDSV
ncbi:hypothetical protein [Leisingera daeponensis]|uniref:hypothetical protein n=1 Tax=Leisingera daeponensis TaxID=405746 RepID=UPI0012B64B9F|nr:hypothetical protein [Leisingera daeponensis]